MKMDLETKSVFRIDRFVVPFESTTAFMDRVKRIQKSLGNLPGNLQNLVLSKINGSNGVDVITIVEWESPEAMAKAAAIVKARYAEEHFDPQVFMKSLGVQPDFGLYSRI